PRDVLARVDLALAELDHVLAAGDLLPHRVLPVQGAPRLVDVGELDRLAHLERAAVHLDLAGDHAEERRLARAVRADDVEDPAGWQVAGEVLHAQAAAQAFLDVRGADDDVPDPRTGGDVDLDGVEPRRLIL